jgi:hypothetical protein
MSTVDPSTADPPFYEGSYTTDVGYADRFVAASFRYRMSGSRILTQLAIFAILGLAWGLIAPASHVETRIIVGVGVFVVGVVVAAITASLSYLSNRRRMRALIPPGSTYAVTMRRNALGLRDWMIASESSYALWRRASIVGDFLVLQRTQSTIFTPLPRQLFTPAIEAWLLARVNDQSPAAR